MAVRVVRIAALILLAIGGIEIVRAEHLLSTRHVVADCDTVDADAAQAPHDDHVGCASYEAVVLRARLATPSTSMRAPAAAVRSLRPGIISPPYHPPR